MGCRSTRDDHQRDLERSLKITFLLFDDGSRRWIDASLNHIFVWEDKLLF
jgi:hypothetical protein